MAEEPGLIFKLETRALKCRRWLVRVNGKMLERSDKMGECVVTGTLAQALEAEGAGGGQG